MFKKSQTATEYLIILAVVIIIALIVVGVLGGIPSIGGGASKNTNDANLRTQSVGIENYVLGTGGSTIIVKNNNPFSVRINDVLVEETSCGTPRFVLKPGQRKTVDCFGYVENIVSKYDRNFRINWTDISTDADYSLDDNSLVLIGDVIDDREYAFFLSSSNYVYYNTSAYTSNHFANKRLSAWVNINTTLGGGETIFYFEYGAGINVMYNGVSGTIRLGKWTDTSFTPTLNQWQFYEIITDSNGRITSFLVDGVQEWSGTGSYDSFGVGPIFSVGPNLDGSIYNVTIADKDTGEIYLHWWGFGVDADSWKDTNKQRDGNISGSLSLFEP